MTGRSPRSAVRGGQVVLVLLLAVLATAVLPPAGAWWLNARRVAETTDRLVSAEGRVTPAARRTVVCGPGRLPPVDTRFAGPTHVAWVSAALINPEPFGAGMPTDAWGRCFLLTDRWLLSAGPNGIVDTPFEATQVVGDDIGRRLQ